MYFCHYWKLQFVTDKSCSTGSGNCNVPWLCKEAFLTFCDTLAAWKLIRDIGVICPHYTQFELYGTPYGTHGETKQKRKGHLCEISDILLELTPKNKGPQGTTSQNAT